MRSEEFKDFKDEDQLSDEGYKRKRGGSHRRGAKTFRRGRANAFLERLNLKRSTIMQQLDKPEFQSIQPILVGELKAIDMIINEFVQLFEIDENEEMEAVNGDKKMKKQVNPLANSEEGSELNETN